MKKESILTKFVKWINTRFELFKWKSWVVYCVVLFIVGAIINIGTNFIFPYFFFHQALLICATTLLICAMNSFFKDIHKFDKDAQESLLAKNPGIDAIYEKKFKKIQVSPWTMVACILVTTFFFACIVLLKYISFDIIGIYALYIAGTSVLIGVYGYMQYLYFLWFIYEVGKYDYSSSYKYYAYDFYAPGETKWVSQLARTSQRLRNYFLCVGLIYVVEYGILVPADKIEIGRDSIMLNLPNNAAFVISWIALFILVIIAFPVINYVQRSLVTNLVNQLKAYSIKELSEQMTEENKLLKSRKERLQSIITYDVLIDHVRKSKSYPINRQLSYETIMTIVTFCVHIFNLYSKVASIPQFSALLPQF